EGGVIRVAFLHDLHDADDGGLRAARVIEEGEIAALDLVAQEVTRLIVAYAVPVRGLARLRRKVVDPEDIGLGLQQPMPHSSPPAKRWNALSVTAPQSGMSHGCFGSSRTCWNDQATPSSFGRVQDLR